MQMLWQLFITFAKIGVMTFGGGMAMLPILDRNLARWSEDRGTVTALREPFQQVCF